MYFQNAAGTRNWFLGLNYDTVGVWQGYGSQFNFAEGWTGGTAGEFAADIADVGAIGISIQAPFDFNANDYGLDDWRYVVPEPGTMCMLAAVFLPLGMTFRRRINALFQTRKQAQV